MRELFEAVLDVTVCRCCLVSTMAHMNAETLFAAACLNLGRALHWLSVMSCHAMSSHSMSCHVMSCHVILRCVVRRRDPSLGRLSRGVRGQMGYDACDVSINRFVVPAPAFPSRSYTHPIFLLKQVDCVRAVCTNVASTDAVRCDFFLFATALYGTSSHKQS